MTFYVGQKVVCVDDDWRMFLPFWMRVKAAFRRRDTDPRRGGIYHVREVLMKDDQPWLRLAEIRNRAELGFVEPMYMGRCFRPVVERKTDISIFTAMLTPAKKAVETVGFLAFMGMIMWVFVFIDATGGQ